LSFVSSTKVSTAKPENLRASVTRLPTVRRPAPSGSSAPGANSGGGFFSRPEGSPFFNRPPGFPLRPFTNQPLPVRLPRTSKAYMGVFSKPESTKPDINLISHFSNLIGNLTKILAVSPPCWPCVVHAAGCRTPRLLRGYPQLIADLELWWNRPRGTLGTGENEWYTPARYIELARSVRASRDRSGRPAASSVPPSSFAYFLIAQPFPPKMMASGRLMLGP
jgi:hypothetical protein